MALADDFDQCRRRCRPTGPSSSSTCGSRTRTATSTPPRCSQINAMPYSAARLALPPARGPRVRPRGARRPSTARWRCSTTRASGELVAREVRLGRVEVTQMWGRPESVRQEFRRRRASSVARVALLCPDLLFGSKLRARWTRTRWSPRRARRSVGRRPDRRRRRAARAGAERRPPTLAFYSHVEQDVRRRPRRRASTGSCRARGWRARPPRSWRGCWDGVLRCRRELPAGS